MKPGVYEEPLTEGLRAIIERSGLESRTVPSTDANLIAQHLAARIERAIELSDDPRGLANRIVDLLADSPGSGATAEDRLVAPLQRLESIAARAGLGLGEHMPRPALPLSRSALLVNGRRDANLTFALRAELRSADRVDLLCSFLKWSGLRLIEQDLRRFLERRPGELRVITTTYQGATEPRAIEALLQMGAQVRVSYDEGSTRLHAKAWRIGRDSGFSTAFVGSSNLSAPAMLDGVEWNVRLSQVEQPDLIAQFEAVFDQYWNDPAFGVYERDRFQAALAARYAEDNRLLALFDVSPRPHQEEILEALQAERAKGHTRNLVVAATGTGKTVVAALDYRRLVEAHGPLKLLFVAHRKEILKQSQQTFQAVMRDRGFGELLVDGATPDSGLHVFASIQSLGPRLASLRPDHYDVVIVDEFHHAAAQSYRVLLDTVKPRFLLGLTATPERADGASVLGWFDGRIAAELRLWKALDQQLLCPFHYFAVGDDTDLRGAWRKGLGYEAQSLTRLYTANHVWADRVLKELAETSPSPSTMRAIGFCASIEHAEFMAAHFNKAGLYSRAVHSRSGNREEALEGLRNGSIRAIFTVDLFNEGIDVPDVDTLLLLRPTESGTVFLQQLGRGLRRAPAKPVLTVLDFVGLAHQSFRFDLIFRAIVGGTRAEVARQVEDGFPTLPSGCAISLDRVAQDTILANIRGWLGNGGWRRLVEDLKAAGDLRLVDFLRRAELDLEDVYPRRDAGWGRLRREAAGSRAEAHPEERALGRMLHVEDPARLLGWRRALREGFDPADPTHRMLAAALWGSTRPLGEMEPPPPGVAAELAELLDALEDRARSLAFPLEGTPLHCHARYSGDEVMGAYGVVDRKGHLFKRREGVLFVEGAATDLLFVTLKKSDADYRASVRYRDYALDPSRFHWETQNTCHFGTSTGQRYVRPPPGHRILLLVRNEKEDARGMANPFLNLGPVACAEWGGARPMQITWELRFPIPASEWMEIKAVSG